MGEHTPNDVGKIEKLALAGVTLPIAEAITTGWLHAGAPGVILGVGAAVAAYSYGDTIIGKFKQARGTAAPRERKPGQPSLAYRLLTPKSMREQEAPFDEDVIEDDLADDILDLGPQLRPQVNTVFSSRIAILGQPGSGKSNALADLAEELGRFDAPLIIFDQKPEYAPLCERPYLNNPYHADASTVTPQTAFQFGIWMMNNRKHVVLDLRSYKDDTTAAKVMIQILAAIWSWEEALANDDRIPCTIFLEEAHWWLPQNERMSTVSRQASKDGDPSIFSKLQQSFFSLATGGRSMGMGFVVSTQRPADIDNRVISGAVWKILLRADLPADLKVYRPLGCSDEVAMSLSTGQAFVKGPGQIKGVYQFRERFSPSEAKTPGYEALKKETPIYQNLPAVNEDMPIYRAVNDPVNGSTRPLEPPTQKPHLHLLGNDVNEASERETPVGESVNVNVNEHVRDTIRRLVDMGKLKHAEIAKVVRLDGRKYSIYQQVCAEMGVKIEREPQS
jgi:Helicase HerA, central domain